MSKHTPGTWTVDLREVFGRGDRPGSAEIVVWDEDGEDSMIIVRDLDFDDAESRANANLIAAAPDLLEALERLMRVVANPDCAEGLALGSARAKATSAIARAKGGS